jgi:hypothetical protein
MDDLIESIETFFLYPRRLSMACEALFGLLTLLLFAGLAGLVAIVGQRAVLSLGKQSGPNLTLEQVLPNLPTWFVPETSFGFVVVGVLMAVTLWGLAVGQRIEQWHRHL